MKIVPIHYQGSALQFQEDGWFNATAAAAKFGKRPADWLKLDSTKQYVESVKRHNSEVKNLHITRKGKSKDFEQGTWLHPKLAVRFAQWLDTDFAVWCDAQIDSLIRGKTDWSKERHQAAASFRVMNDVLRLKREDDGKETAPHHYTNEARLINWLMSGKFGKLDRETLSASDLGMLAMLEEKNAVLIGGSLNYEERKSILEQYARSFKTKALKAA